MSKPLDQFAAATESAMAILARTPLRPRVAVVLGSGLDPFAESLHRELAVLASEVPHFPVPGVAGHTGRLTLGTIANLPIAVLQGRPHYYEGFTLPQVAFPIEVFRCMGIQGVVLTNAAGGINPAYRRGSLVVIRDHINLMGGSPLIGPNDERLGPRFPDMTCAYDSEFRQAAIEEAARQGIELPEGVYAAMHGPSYETPAEIQFLARIGADLVGMSTVPEVIAARHGGLRVLAISCVTNPAAGLSNQILCHQDVLDVSRRTAALLEKLLLGVLPRLAAILSRRNEA